MRQDVRGRLVHRADQPPGRLFHDLDGLSACPAQAGHPGRVRPAGPVPAGRPAAQQRPAAQVRGDVGGGRAEQPEIRLGQRQLGGGRAQVRGQHVGIPRIEHGRLDRMPQDLRVVDEVGVERVVPGDQHRDRAGAPPAGPASLLPQGRPGAWPAGDEHGVQAGDVDPEFEGGGGGQAGQPAPTQRRLHAAPVLGQVSGPVRRDPVGVAGRPLLGQQPLGVQRHGLGGAAGADERQRRDVLADQAGEKLRGLGGRCAAHRSTRLAPGLGQRRFPQGERHRPVRRSVRGDFLCGQAGQAARSLTCLPRGGGGEDEDRAGLGGVVRAHPAEPAQHVSHMGPEDPPVSVALVDDHIAQLAEEAGPAAMLRQQDVMQHVGVGEQVTGVRPGPGAFARTRVAVQRGGPDTRQPEGPDRGKLISGQRLRGRDVQRRPARQDPGQGGQQVPERFPGGGPGRDDHVAAVPGVIGRRDLMRPRGPDSPAAEGRGQLGGNPLRPGRGDAGAARDLLQMDQPAGPPSLLQQAEGGNRRSLRRLWRGRSRRSLCGGGARRGDSGPQGADRGADGAGAGGGPDRTRVPSARRLTRQGVDRSHGFSASSVVAACPAPGFRIDMTPERG